MNRLENFSAGNGQPSLSRTPTPAFLPAPLDVQADLRRVRWGSNEVMRGEMNPSVSDDDNDDAAGRSDGDDDEGEGEAAGQWSAGVTLAITATKGKLGCAYYDGEANKLLFLEDSEDSPLEQWDLVTDSPSPLPCLPRATAPFQGDLTRLLHPVVNQLNPAIVLTPATADPAFLTTLQVALASLAPDSSASSRSGAAESDAHPIKLEFRPGREFNPGNGRVALAQVLVVEGGMYALQEADDEDDDDAQGSKDAYSFNGGQRKRDYGIFQGDRARRNGELRLESFVNGLATSPLTVSPSCKRLGSAYADKLKPEPEARLRRGAAGPSGEREECSRRARRRNSGLGTRAHDPVRRPLSVSQRQL